MADPSRAAAFLDRDGTIIVDAEYTSRADQVVLLPGAAEAIRRLNESGVPVVVVTNQSGIARGYLDLVAYESVRARLDELLAAHGARVDATYMCPHHPDFDVACECRKPGTLLYRRAIADLGLDATRSWFVGDRWRDVAPAIALGGTGVLVPGEFSPPEDVERARREASVAPSLAEVVDRMLAAPVPGTT